MDFFRKALADVEGEMMSNAGIDPASRPAPAAAEPPSSNSGLGIFSHAAELASSATGHLSALSSGAASAAAELALREELSRKEDALATAEAQVAQLQQQLQTAKKQQPQPEAPAAAAAQLAAAEAENRKSQERLAALEARDAKLKGLLKKQHEAKTQLEERLQQAEARADAASTPEKVAALEEALAVAQQRLREQAEVAASGVRTDAAVAHEEHLAAREAAVRQAEEKAAARAEELTGALNEREREASSREAHLAGREAELEARQLDLRQRLDELGERAADAQAPLTHLAACLDPGPRASAVPACLPVGSASFPCAAARGALAGTAAPAGRTRGRPGEARRFASPRR